MTLPARFDDLSTYFDDDGPAHDALAAHSHAVGLLAAARERVRDLSSPGKSRAAQATDDLAAIEAASARKAPPKRTAAAKLAEELAAQRELVDALVRHVDTVRDQALAAIADDVPRRLEALEERRASAAVRAGHLVRELAEALDEIDATVEARAVLAAVESGNRLFLDPEIAAVVKAASRATRGSAVVVKAARLPDDGMTAVVKPDGSDVKVPRHATGMVEIADALSAIVERAQRVPDVEALDRGMTPAERLGSRTPTVVR